MENRKQEASRKKQDKHTIIQSYKDLRVFQLVYQLAMEVFWLTKQFPKEETYSLTDQIRRSSRSICSNIVEGWAKRRYENLFKKHLIDSIGSCDETKLWLQFSVDCEYVSEDKHRYFHEKYEEAGKMLKGLHDNWKTY